LDIGSASCVVTGILVVMDRLGQQPDLRGCREENGCGARHRCTRSVPMLYAALKTVHFLSLVAWVGGMFFMLACVRPSLGVLEGPARMRLMREVMGRFFAIVNVVIGLMLLSGIWMLWIARGVRGSMSNLPPAWYVMIGLGLVMIGVYEYVRGSLFRRMKAALDAQDGAAAAAAMGKIRSAVTFNLILGVVVIVVMKVGVAAQS
jgi:uncharacterized membrane protein